MTGTVRTLFLTLKSYMRNLELKFPPPVIMLIFAFLMILSPPLGELPLSFEARNTVVMTLMGAGFLLGLAAFMDFKKYGTTLDPLKPEEASTLVTKGMYQYSRNPMYVALTLFLLAWAVNLNSAMTFIFIPCFLAYIRRFQIIPEERILRDKFGAEFEAYEAKVRRWI